jgi:hypothetical protein
MDIAKLDPPIVFKLLPILVKDVLHRLPPLTSPIGIRLDGNSAAKISQGTNGRSQESRRIDQGLSSSLSLSFPPIARLFEPPNLSPTAEIPSHYTRRATDEERGEIHDLESSTAPFRAVGAVGAPGFRNFLCTRSREDFTEPDYTYRTYRIWI